MVKVLDYLLAEQGDIYVSNTTCYPWIDTSGEAETYLYKVAEQESIPSMGS